MSYSSFHTPSPLSSDEARTKLHYGGSVRMVDTLAPTDDTKPASYSVTYGSGTSYDRGLEVTEHDYNGRATLTRHLSPTEGRQWLNDRLPYMAWKTSPN